MKRAAYKRRLPAKAKRSLPVPRDQLTASAIPDDAAIVSAIKEYLNNVGDRQFTTTDLMKVLWPMADGGHLARKLSALAYSTLYRYASRGPEKSFMGKTARPWIWHAPNRGATATP